MTQNSNLLSKCQFSTPFETGVGPVEDGMVVVWNWLFSFGFNLGNGSASNDIYWDSVPGTPKVLLG